MADVTLVGNTYIGAWFTLGQKEPENLQEVIVFRMNGKITSDIYDKENKCFMFDFTDEDKPAPAIYWSAYPDPPANLREDILEALSRED